MRQGGGGGGGNRGDRGGRRRGRGGRNRSGGGQGGQQQGKNRGQQPNQKSGQPHGGGQRGQPPAQQSQPKAAKLPPVKSRELPPKRFGVVFHDTFAAAKNDLENVKAQAAAVDQLNIVIAEEGNMDDPVLSALGKVFAGAAWTLIHKRRVEDGWYNTMQPAGPVIPAVKPGSQSQANH
jgi:hypothetical protein